MFILVQVLNLDLRPHLHLSLLLFLLCLILICFTPSPCSFCMFPLFMAAFFFFSYLLIFIASWLSFYLRFPSFGFVISPLPFSSIRFTSSSLALVLSSNFLLSAILVLYFLIVPAPRSHLLLLHLPL